MRSRPQRRRHDRRDCTCLRAERGTNVDRRQLDDLIQFLAAMHYAATRAHPEALVRWAYLWCVSSVRSSFEMGCALSS